MYDNEAINRLTDQDQRYKMISTCLSVGYNSLKPARVSNAARGIFDIIISNKMYGSVGKAKHPQEVFRIFNDIRIDVDMVLREVNSGKYDDGGLYKKGKNIATDRANMVSLLKQIDEMNIFHIWKYKDNYMFFIERHLSVWKYYNEDAVIPPKTIKKIAKIAHSAVDTMCKFEHKSGRVAVIADIQNSYGRFIEKLVLGMSVAVSAKIPDWELCNNFHEYIEILKDSVNQLFDFDGLNVADSFFKILPPSVINILELDSSKGKHKMNDNKKTEMEKELTPKSANVCSNKGTRVKKGTNQKKVSKKKETKDDDPENFGLLGFGDSVKINPFKDAPTFAIYYRSFVSLHSEQEPKFDNIQTFTQDAGVILDRLGELEKKGDFKFLEAWLKNFIATGLKGGKIKNKKYTHLKNLYGTLNKFNEIFYIPQD